jgi:hypothetical protein
VVEQALAALRGVGSPTDVAQSTRETAAEIERVWQRRPFVAALEGNLVARGELVNLLVGDRVLDPFRRALGCPPLRLERGEVVCYRVVRRDDTSEDKVLPPPEPRDDDDERERRAQVVRDELAGHEEERDTIERALPVLARRRPAPWAFWLWPIFWLLGLVHRQRLRTWQTARRAVEDARHRLSGLEDAVLLREQREQAAREAYYAELRALCGGGAAGADIRQIELDVPSMPANVELVELMGELRASADFDAVLVVERDALYAPMPDGTKVRLGDPATVIADLPALLARARASRLGRRARDKLASVRRDIERELARSEDGFDARLKKLYKLALPLDQAGFRAAQLARVAPQISASINAVIEHASVHLGTELAQLGQAWLASVTGATSGDQLKAAIAAIEEQWPAAAIRIADEVRVLVTGGAGGVARDLCPEIVSSLAAHGLGGEHLRAPKLAPEVDPVPILPSLTAPATFALGGSWLGGLFKSLDAKKSDTRGKLEARIAHIREVATAELLDAEPKLHAAVSRSLVAQLDTAMTAQQSWYQQAVADEHAAIAHDREALAPQLASREALARAEAEIARLVDALDAEQPAIAAAAVAAAS